MTFHADLAFGSLYETKLLDYVEHDSFLFSPPKTKGWDVQTTYGDSIIKWEVKADRLAFRLGNLAIETSCNGVPSGLSITEADFYAIFVLLPASEPTLYLISTENLRALVTNPLYRIVRGGDGGRSTMVLLPLSVMACFLF